MRKKFKNISNTCNNSNTCNTVLLLITFILFSCGAKKTDIKRSEQTVNTELKDKSQVDKVEEAKAVSEQNISYTIDKTVNNQDQTTTVKEIIEPVDNTKKAVYKDKEGNLHELNNTKKTTETTTKNNNTKTELKEKIESNKKSDSTIIKKESSKKDIVAKSDAKKEEEDINRDRKAWSPWNILWFLIPLIGLFFLIRFLYKKYKKKNPLLP